MSAAPRQSIGRRRHLGRGVAVSLLAASVFVAASPASAAQGAVALGTAESFAVLAGSAITNTGPTTITGDVGTFPTPTETGFGSITLNGTDHAGDSVTQGAKTDLVAAYNDAAGRLPATSHPVELGGSTLLAGVYASPTFGLTGTLTLDAKGIPDAQFIFQAASTLITESNSRVLLLNGADPCNVVWQVGSSATFKTGSQFVGTVLALQSITAQTGAAFQGRLLARNAAVTLDTNTITAAGCVVPASSGGAITTPDATTSTPIGTTTPTVTGAGPGSPTETSAGTPGSPPATRAGAPGSPRRPGGPSATTPGIPSTSPPLADTGAPVDALLRNGIVLLVLGVGALVVGRRRPRVQVA